MGLSGPPSTSSQHYGLCDDRAERLGAIPRKLYEWQAEKCDLPAFDRARACSLFEGKQVVVAGDSTAGQLFLSLVLLLGGSFGRNSRHTSVISDITASVCDNKGRFVFIRNDLLLWSTHRSEFNRARECDKLLKADAFVQRVARDAHLLILATGHHFPASMEAAAVMSGGGGAATNGLSFFASSMNYTLSNLMATRAAWGHAPESVALMGASIPVPSCSRFTEPLTAAGWLHADTVLGSGNKYSPRWRMMPRLNSILQWLATSYGTAFVDIAAPSSRWPSGMMASSVRGAGSVDEDCLHSCLPGPVDTYSHLVIENLLARRQQIDAGSTSAAALMNHPKHHGRRAGGAAAAASAGAGNDGDAGKPRVATDGRRFFGVPISAWLHERNSGSQFESCGSARGQCVRADASRQPWWPFSDCMKKRTLAFCDGAECRGPVRKGSILRLCDSQGGGCRNFTMGALRAAAAHGLLR